MHLSNVHIAGQTSLFIATWFISDAYIPIWAVLVLINIFSNMCNVSSSLG